MNRDRFKFVCNETEEGRDAFVSHPQQSEEGRVTGCTMSHVLVETSDGQSRCWDFNEVREMSRDNREFPYR